MRFAKSVMSVLFSRQQELKVTFYTSTHTESCAPIAATSGVNRDTMIFREHLLSKRSTCLRYFWTLHQDRFRYNPPLAPKALVASLETWNSGLTTQAFTGRRICCIILSPHFLSLYRRYSITQNLFSHFQSKAEPPHICVSCSRITWTGGGKKKVFFPL